MSVPVIRRTESPCVGTHGHTLFRRAWLPAHPERALLVVHGWAEHSGRYEHLGAWFATRGCAVHAYDQLGHGRASGPRGHVRRFEEYLDDLGQQLDAVRSEHPQLPVFFVGHSLGGLITAAFARERQPEISGMVLSAPALLVRVSGAKRFLARFARRLLPRLSLNVGIDASLLAHDPEVVRAYREDPLVFETMTASLGAEMMEVAERTLAGAGEVSLPTLLLHGVDDRLCPVEGSRRFCAGLEVSQKQLYEYPALYHEIFNEPEHAKIFEDLFAWLCEVRPSASASRTAEAG